MPDVVWGNVISVIDGDTFELGVTHVGDSNAYQYGSLERVRLTGIDAPEISSPGGQAAKARLQDKIEGKAVQVVVHGRDTYGRVLGELV